MRGNAQLSPSIPGPGALPELDPRTACVPAQHAPLCRATRDTWPAGSRAEARRVFLLQGACELQALAGRPMLFRAGLLASRPLSNSRPVRTPGCRLLENLALYVFQAVDGRLLRDHVLHARLLRLRAPPHPGERGSLSQNSRPAQAGKQARAQDRHSAFLPVARTGLSKKRCRPHGCQRSAEAQRRRRRKSHRVGDVDAGPVVQLQVVALVQHDGRDALPPEDPHAPARARALAARPPPARPAGRFTGAGPCCLALTADAARR